MDDLRGLNSLHSIPGRLVFKEGAGGLVFAEVNNEFATGRVYLQGGHVTHFQPKEQEPVLWVSDRSLFQRGKAIRGGIPICWPWFGNHPDDGRMQAHGFVRTSLWEILGSGETAGQETYIRLGLSENEKTLVLWSHPFSLELDVIFGKGLSVSLSIKNSGDSPFRCTGALHSYFYVADSKQIRILGLAGKEYLDKDDGFRRKKQEGPVVVERETDRIYLEVTEECLVEDPVLQRIISIHKKGSKTTVVWNPGPEKSGKMPDMGENGYRNMICVETANAADDIIALAPGQTHLITTLCSVASWSRNYSP
jgi:glucose-6-phosphate 1-epimerase